MTETRREVGENAWVEFKATGYPFSLRKKLAEAKDDTAVLEIVLGYIVALDLPTLDGKRLTIAHSIDDLANVDEQICVNIIWKFYDFRADRQREPLPKNS